MSHATLYFYIINTHWGYFAIDEDEFVRLMNLPDGTGAALYLDN